MNSISFKNFLVTSALNEQKTFVSEGIAHIEDLPIEDFLFAIENFNKMIATQKLDGANLRVGVDKDGKFYTSRESKGGKRFYKTSDYPDDVIAMDGFRSAHQALEKKKSEIAKVLGSGSACEIEILYKRQPNAITYGKDGLNYIAFLRMLETPEDETPDQSKIKRLLDELEGDTVTVNSRVTDTEDGESLIVSKEDTTWKFTAPEKVSAAQFKSVNLKKEIEGLKKYLNAPNKAAAKLGDPAVTTNYDVMSITKKDLRDERERVKAVVQKDYKLAIKDTLLKTFVRNIKPSIQDADLHPDEDLGIEGVVFLDPVTQKQFKIVDKDVFTTMNAFNHEVRSNISGTIKSSDPLATIANRGGIFGDAKIRMIKLFGIDGLSTASNVKRTLRKFGGDTPEQMVVNMAKSLNQVNEQATKKKMQAIIIATLDDLQQALKDFKSNADKYKKKLSTGKTVGYSPEIRKRTLLTFAETKKALQDLLAQVKGSKNIADLIVAMFGRQIKDIFSEQEDE
jgi:hypothetical protein